MMKVLTRAGLLIGTVLIAAGTAAPAYAADVPGLEDAKKLVTARIDGRLGALHALQIAVNGAQKLTPAHKSTLDGVLSSDVTGLTALRTKVAGETTLAAVKADADSMVNDYRVYLLVEPKVRLTITADIGSAIHADLVQVHDRLANAVAAAKKAGKDVGTAEADLADMDSQLQNAQTVMAGKIDALLAIQPGPDGDAIQQQLLPVRQAVGTAKGDLRKASADAKHVRDILKGLGTTA
jgi:hypothetical protein